MVENMLRAGFGKRDKDLYYMVKYDLKPDREWKRKEMRIARAIEQSAARQ